MKSRLNVLNRITIFFVMLSTIDSITIIPFDAKEVYILAFGSILTIGYTAYFGAKTYEKTKSPPSNNRN